MSSARPRFGGRHEVDDADEVKNLHPGILLDVGYDPALLSYHLRHELEEGGHSFCVFEIDLNAAAPLERHGLR